jgi:hypothetical protein
MFVGLLIYCRSLISLGLHPALFFSYKPALKDYLGVAIDTGPVTLACVGGSRDNRRVHFKWYKDGALLKADASPIIATIAGDLTINPSDYTRDDGFYRCLITDNTWSLLSNMADLQLACKYKILYTSLLCTLLYKAKSFSDQ